MSPETPMDLEPIAAGGGLEEEARRGLDGLRASLEEKGPTFLVDFLAAVPRRVGRKLLPPDQSGALPGCDLGTWRACDLATADLLGRALRSGAPEGFLGILFRQGDAEERRMILKALPVLGDGVEIVELLGEAHRSNDQILFEAGLCDSDLPARCLPDDPYANFVLKAAFLDLPLERLPGARGRAREALSAMLLDFMSEREAAGRPVWAPTLELASHAPCPGVAARVIGELWSGVDRRRLAAARGARILEKAELVPFLRQRLEHELLAQVRGEIESALEGR